MPPLSQVLPKDAVRILEKIGFVSTHQSGSHIRLAHQDGRKVTIALHAKPMPKGTLAAVLRQARVSRVEFQGIIDGQ